MIAAQLERLSIIGEHSFFQITCAQITYGHSLQTSATFT
ncbi:hypothetical protein PPIS_b0400 [Pseudoalteromonas piscicida]|uniref:Uncharacterized protein n=1 Tax=Pseudoalteromonas piscicida TaxID=43662 RepID=A0ABN5CJ75_PSEO7|nr:hypothetical protein PPIS_b0400 [Pseudoalteromonas piscicida]